MDFVEFVNFFWFHPFLMKDDMILWTTLFSLLSRFYFKYYLRVFTNYFSSCFDKKFKNAVKLSKTKLNSLDKINKL